MLGAVAQVSAPGEGVVCRDVRFEGSRQWAAGGIILQPVLKVVRILKEVDQVISRLSRRDGCRAGRCCTELRVVAVHSLELFTSASQDSGHVSLQEVKW